METYGYPAWTRPENIVTNGAFRLQSRQVRQRTRLVKSENYWNAANVRLNTIDVLPVESQTTALNLYLTGQVDWIPKAPNTIVPELLAQKRDDLFPQPQMTIYFYRLNCTQTAAGQEAGAEGAGAGGEQAANRGRRDARRRGSGLELRAAGADRVRAGHRASRTIRRLARKLLAEAGYPGGRGLPKIEISYNTDEGHQSIAELIQAQWKENLGIDVGLQNMEWNAYLAAQRNLQYQVSRGRLDRRLSRPQHFFGHVDDRQHEQSNRLVEQEVRQADRRGRQGTATRRSG